MVHMGTHGRGSYYIIPYGSYGQPFSGAGRCSTDYPRVSPRCLYQNVIKNISSILPYLLRGSIERIILSNSSSLHSSP